MNGAGSIPIPGPVGRLEALYRSTDRPSRAAVICHPHPQHGGTMHNKVVYRTAKAFEGLGWSVLRFNFRGAGRSEGSFDDGIGEAEDVAAALDWLAGEHPGVPLVVGGFSFGSAVGLPVAATDPRVTHLVGIGTPTGRFDFDALADVPKPKLFVQGGRDEHGPVADLRQGLGRVADPWRLVVIEEADHFLTGRLYELQRALVDFFSVE